MIVNLPTVMLDGIHSTRITIQVSSSQGMLPSLIITGLPDTGLKESRERVESAIRAVGHKVPPRKITINLAPADIRKKGTHFDLPLAIALLSHLGAVPPIVEGTTLVGELGLDGTLHGGTWINGLLIACYELGFTKVLIPQDCCELICFGNVGLELIPVATLGEAIRVLNGEIRVEPFTPPDVPYGDSESTTDFAHIIGQSHGVQGALIAACGHHNLLLSGPPGIGKSMIAQALTGILPPLDTDDYMAVLKIHSAAGFPYQQRSRKLRAPHSSASLVALIGGSHGPGEISLAHHSILLLDEMPEFNRAALDALRQPLETGTIHISRSSSKQCYPAEILLVGTMNLCPCGKTGADDLQCTCKEYDRIRYQAKLSEPLLDRIDLHLSLRKESTQATNPTSAELAEQVARCRAVQLERQGCLNGKLSGEAMREQCALAPELDELLRRATTQYALSRRAIDRIVRVARTLSDMRPIPQIDRAALLQALNYRRR
ncbi:YifB family Mg chelatase-like AAA ATPase [Chrysiogenes arsenatis]|uniref:YifB family Mg chelatase-like AAA ATPase n=1 Tax=Chrysiogenes arsenatis TaxID=309797 RepID=UPI000402FF1A|nr:YifB family Mg chelatase-like AAA ATPase [Chrysiogenes arsenatis]